MSEQTTQIVEKATPVVLSDSLVSKVDVIQQQAQRIGQLEGENEIFRNNFEVATAKFQEELDKTAKEVTVVIKDGRYSSSATSSWQDPFQMIVEKLTGGANVEVITKNVDSLEELANASVQGDAKKEVEKAQKAQKEAEKLEKFAKDRLKEYKANAEKETEEAIEKAEKRNLKKIADLELLIKALRKQQDLDDLEYSSLQAKYDLVVEEADKREKLFRKQIALLAEPAKNTLINAMAKVQYWWAGRMLKIRS
jgi:hypothetical protein